MINTVPASYDMICSEVLVESDISIILRADILTEEIERD